MAKKKNTEAIKKSVGSKPAKSAKVNAVNAAAKTREVKKKTAAQPVVKSRTPKPDTSGSTTGKENAKQRGIELQAQTASGYFEVVKSAMTDLRRRLRTQSRKSSEATGHSADLDAALTRLVEDYKQVLGMRDA